MSALTTPSRPRSFWPVLFWYGGLTMLLLGELAVMLRPEQLPWLALFGLAYPLSSAVFLVGTLGAWAVRRWRLGLIGLLVISVLSSHYTSTWGGWGRGQAQEAEVQTLRVLTWNVRQFNRYAWIEKPCAGFHSSLLVSTRGRCDLFARVLLGRPAPALDVF